MIETAAILAALLAGGPAYEERSEPPAVRVERLRGYAIAINDAVKRAICYGRTECTPVWAGPPETLAALLIVKAKEESGLLGRIAEGRCRRNECDAMVVRGKVVHRSIGLWQLQAGYVPQEEWEKLPGNVRLQAWHAARVLGRGYDYCKGSVTGAVSIYATGKTCKWSGAAPRVRRAKKIEATLRKKLTQ